MVLVAADTALRLVMVTVITVSAPMAASENDMLTVGDAGSGMESVADAAVPVTGEPSRVPVTGVDVLVFGPPDVVPGIVNVAVIPQLPAAKVPPDKFKTPVPTPPTVPPHPLLSTDASTVPGITVAKSSLKASAVSVPSRLVFAIV